MGLPGLPEPGFSETQPTDLGSIGPSNSAISHGLPGLPMPGFSEQVPEQSGGIFSTIKNFGSGSLRGAAQLAALGGDIVTSIPRWGIEYATGQDIPSMGSAMEEALNQIGLPRKDSIAQRIGEFTIPLGPQFKALQMGTGALMGAANYGAEKLLPDNPIAQAAITIGAGLSPFAAETAAKSLFRTLSPKAGAANAARKIAEELRSVTPNALTEAMTPADRAKLAAEALDAKGLQARKAAGELFQSLPDDSVTLDSAIKNISDFAEQVGGPISPSGQTNSVIRFLQGLKPQDKVINIPASTILDETGKPMQEAVSMTIPGGPAKLPLNKVQDTLRDIGKLGYGAQGVEAAILGRARDEILKAAEASVKPESMEAFKGARAAWREMSQTYEEGAVGAVRNSVADVDGRLNTFRNRLLNDPKGAEQLAHVMSPEELRNAQNLILTDLLKRQPVSWEREISQKYDSYKAIFGTDGADKLLNMVARDGTIGKKLLQDNNGLKTLFTKLAFKTAIGGALGYEAGGTEGAVIGGLFGLASNRAEGLRVNRAKSLIMRAAAGNPEALKILNTPARSLGYDKAINSLASLIKEGFQELSGKAASSSGESLRPSAIGGKGGTFAPLGDSAESIPLESRKTVKTSPSYKYLPNTSVSDVLSDSSFISHYNNTIKELPFLEKTLNEVAGNNPIKAGVKTKEEAAAKIIRKISEGKSNYSEADLGDLIRGRVETKATADAYKALERAKSTGVVTDINDYFKKPTDFGFKGINLNIKTPKGNVGEIQIHTPESLAIKDAIRPIYEKWRHELIVPDSVRIESLKLAAEASKKVLGKSDAGRTTLGAMAGAGGIAGIGSIFSAPQKKESTNKASEPMAQIPKQLLDAVKQQESGGKINAVSPAGAKGLYQLMDATGKEWHAKLGLPGIYDPFDAKQNETIAKAYLSWLSDQFGGDVKLALASFNHGIGNIKKLISKYGASFEDIKAHLPDETQKYVPSILAKANLPSDILEA